MASVLRPESWTFRITTVSHWNWISFPDSPLRRHQNKFKRKRHHSCHICPTFWWNALSKREQGCLGFFIALSKFLKPCLIIIQQIWHIILCSSGHVIGVRIIPGSGVHWIYFESSYQAHATIFKQNPWPGWLILATVYNSQADTIWTEWYQAREQVSNTAWKNPLLLTSMFPGHDMNSQATKHISQSTIVRSAL